MGGAGPRISPPGELAPEYVRLLLAIRWARRWTQRQLADALGVHPITVSRWERGQQEPHPGWLQLLRPFLRSSGGFDGPPP